MLYLSKSMVVYHLPRIPGNSGWDVNCKRFFGSSHRKIPGTNGNSEKVVPVFPIGTFRQVSCISYRFHVVTRIQSSAARQSPFLPTENSQTRFSEFFYKWYPASRGFSLVFLSVLLPFSSRFWLLAFCFGCFCAEELACVIFKIDIFSKY